MRPKHETCINVKSVGAIAVYVTPGCPRALLVKGTLVSTMRRCEDCRSYTSKYKGENECT